MQKGTDREVPRHPQPHLPYPPCPLQIPSFSDLWLILLVLPQVNTGKYEYIFFLSLLFTNGQWYPVSSDFVCFIHHHISSAIRKCILLFYVPPRNCKMLPIKLWQVLVCHIDYKLDSYFGDIKIGKNVLATHILAFFFFNISSQSSSSFFNDYVIFYSVDVPQYIQPVGHWMFLIFCYCNTVMSKLILFQLIIQMQIYLQDRFLGIELWAEG